MATELQFDLVVAVSHTQDTDSLHIIFVYSMWSEIYAYGCNSTNLTDVKLKLCLMSLAENHL